jgi:hypothetical protein
MAIVFPMSSYMSCEPRSAFVAEGIGDIVKPWYSYERNVRAAVCMYVCWAMNDWIFVSRHKTPPS